MATVTKLKVAGADVTRFAPASTPNGGVIIIAYGSDGMGGPWGPMIQGYAEALADQGFVTFLPDYLAATKTKPGSGVFAVMGDLRSSWEGILAATIDQAKVGAKGVGLLGFSLGGHLCLRLRSKANVLVEFFAPVLDGLGTPGQLSQAEIHHGKDDRVPGTGYENAGAVESLLKGELTRTKLWSYANAGHGFVSAAAAGANLGGTDAGNTAAQTKSRTRTLKFFAKHLPLGA